LREDVSYKGGDEKRRKYMPQSTIIVLEETTMAIPLNKLVGMTPEIAAKLKDKEIHDSDQLLDASRTPHERKELAKHCGITTRAFLALADRADLARIHGVGGVLSDLLEQIKGVKTVSDLAKQRPVALYHELEDLIEEKTIKLVGRVPSIKMMNDWIKQAKALEKTLF
jgi:predicted flap endonuclease-1-like 5' DNA nuclease